MIMLMNDNPRNARIGELDHHQQNTIRIGQQREDLKN
jgi:hypothetical protein